MASQDASRRSTRDNTARVALIACGALAREAARVAETTDWPVDVHPLPPLLHNRPERIAGEVEALAAQLIPRYRRVVVGYADCGTRGAVDEVCERLRLSRLAGITCYDLYAGAEQFTRLTEDQPGTFFVTDYLAVAFHRSVIVELGLDRYPQLRDDYFGHYTRIVWLAQEPDDPQVAAAAQEAARRIDLPLETVPTGRSGLLAEMARLVAG
ncbi:MAG: DUF1638 domain-containing protein [Actinomycetales bacterium]